MVTIRKEKGNMHEKDAHVEFTADERDFLETYRTLLRLLFAPRGIAKGAA